MSAQCIIEYHQVSGEANPVGLLHVSEYVGKPAEQQGEDGTTNDSHYQQRGAGLRKLTQVFHCQRPQGRPHQRVSQTQEGYEPDRKTQRSQHNQQRTDQTDDRANKHRLLLRNIFRDKEYTHQITDHHADYRIRGVHLRIRQMLECSIVDDTSHRQRFDTHVEQ